MATFIDNVTYHVELDLLVRQLMIKEMTPSMQLQRSYLLYSDNIWIITEDHPTTFSSFFLRLQLQDNLTKSN